MSCVKSFAFNHLHTPARDSDSETLLKLLNVSQVDVSCNNAASYAGMATTDSIVGSTMRLVKRCDRNVCDVCMGHVSIEG